MFPFTSTFYTVLQRLLKNTHCADYARKRVYTDPYIPYKEKIEHFTGQKRTVFWHILRKYKLLR